MQTKTILIIVLAILSMVLVGVSVYRNLNQPEPSPVVVNLPQVNQEQNNAQCVAEGGNGSTESGDSRYDQSCCVGLIKISTATFNPSVGGNGCEGGVNNPGNFICAYCGNGVCGKGENQCNCPTDCTPCIKEGELIYKNQTCCAGFSQISLTMLGNDNHCYPSVNNPEMIGICTKCGDGFCDNAKLNGENQCNCPQDCGNIPSNNVAIRMGKFNIDPATLNRIQNGADSNQSSYFGYSLQADKVLRVYGSNYNFTLEDLENAKKVFSATSAGAVQYEVSHNGVIYIISLTQPVPGEGKIWIINEISKK
jgi:hypothetical protein